MNVQLISRDPSLHKLCREILNEYDGLDCHLTQTSAASCAPGADLYIWDDTTAIEVSRGVDKDFSRHVFLLHRDDVAKFREKSGKLEVAILLKPVTRASLSAFVGFAASSFQDRVSTPRSLRADRDEILQCLIQSNLQLQQYDQDRTHFLTRAVHDFRAPLTATGGYCGLLLSEALGPVTDQQKEVLRRMQHSIKRLSRMASAMFELGVARHEKRQLDLRPGDIRERIEQAVHEITPLADEKNISISVELAPESGTVYLEPGQIEQVLINLLDNACKFTPRDGVIEIQGYPYFWDRRKGVHSINSNGRERRYDDSSAPNSYRVDIRDSGPQIPREHIGRIFEEYTSYVGGRDRSGGGLGLAICRMIITSHEGHVWIENTEYGPQFSFVLPVHATAIGALRAETKTQLTNCEAS